jgi:hypothetical protein
VFASDCWAGSEPARPSAAALARAFLPVGRGWGRCLWVSSDICPGHFFPRREQGIRPVSADIFTQLSQWAMMAAWGETMPFVHRGFFCDFRAPAHHRRSDGGSLFAWLQMRAQRKTHQKSPQVGLVFRRHTREAGMALGIRSRRYSDFGGKRAATAALYLREAQINRRSQR